METSNWIRTEDKLPDNNRVVEVYHVGMWGTFRSFACWNNEERHWFDDDGWYTSGGFSFTHWKEVTAAPDTEAAET